MSRGFQSEYLLYVKKRDEELQSVETQQGKHAGVKPLNVSCTLANVVREHGRLVIQRPGLDVSRSPSERRRKGREVKEVLNVSEGRKKKFGFPAREKEVVEKKESVGLGGQDQSGEKARSLRCATWSCDPGPGLQPSSSPVREPEPSTSNSGDWLRSIAGGSHDPDPEYEIEDVSDTDTSTSLTTTTDSEERIAKTLEERVLATHVHVESKPQDVCLPKSPANVNMPSTKSTEKKIVVESLLANRPKRIVVPKSPEDATGLSWTEETQLKKALYASLQESRLQRQTSKQSDVTDGDFPHEGSIESTGDEFQFPSSFKLDDMVVKRGRKRKLESETSSVSSMATSSAMSPTKEQPKYIKPDAFDLKKAQVRAQRKFAQGSRPNSPNITPVKIKPGVASLPVVAPCKRARTEDFLTFLCLRGTPALPSHLDFFNYPPEYTDDIASTVSTPKHSRKSFLKRDVRSNSPQSSGSSTADRRDVSDKTGDLGVKPMRLGSPPKPLKKKKKQNKEPPSLVPSVTATLKCPPKVLTPTPLKAMTQLKPRKKKVDLSLQGQVKVEEDVEEKRPRLRTLRQPLRRGGPKTRAFFLAKNARRTVRRKVKVMKTEELDDVDVVSVDLEEIQEKAAKRLRAQKVIKRTINKLRHTGKSKRNQPRSLRSSTMVQRSSTLETEPAEPIVRETRSRVSLSPSSRPAPLLPETRMKRPVGRPRTIKLDLPVSPRITRQTGPQVKPPESPSSRRSRPLRRIHVESLPDDLFDFEDPPHESRSPRRRRSDARPQNLPPRPTRTRRQSYGSSIGTRSLSSESHRSTSRESSPEKRTRSGTRSSPRIRVHPGVVEEQPSSRPVTRRSRASYSELSLDVSGFSDDPESHPKSPSVRSTASGKSVSSVSSLRYSIKSGELSPVGSRGRSEKSQAGKLATASANTLVVASASKLTPSTKQSSTSSAKQNTPGKRPATPFGRQGATPSDKHDKISTEMQVTTPTKRHTVASTGQQGVTPAEKSAVSPTRRQAVNAQGKQGGSPTRKKAASPTRKPAVSPTRKQTVVTTGTDLVIPTGKQIVTTAGKQAITTTVRQQVAPSRTIILSGKPAVTASGKRTIILTGKEAVIPDGAATAGEQDAISQVGGHVATSTQRPTTQDASPTRIQARAQTGTGSPSGKPAYTNAGMSHAVPSGPVSPTRRSAMATASATGKQGAVSVKARSPASDAPAQKPVPALVKTSTMTSASPSDNQTLASPGRQVTNASRMLSPSHSKGTSTALAPRDTLAATSPRVPHVTLSPKGSPTTPKASQITVSPRGTVTSISPRGTLGSSTQRVSSASASPKSVTVPRLSPVTIAPRTIPVTIMPKGSPLTTSPKTTSHTSPKGSLSTAVSPRKNTTAKPSSHAPQSIHFVTSNKPSVYVPGRSTNIGARIAANPKLNYRTTSTIGMASMTKAIPLAARPGTIVKPSAAGIKIPASPEKTSGVNMLLKFASSAARPPTNIASSALENKSGTNAASVSSKPLLFATKAANSHTSCVQSNLANKSQVQSKDVNVMSNLEGAKGKSAVSKAADLNKTTKDTSVKIMPRNATATVVKTSLNCTVVKSSMSDRPSGSTLAQSKPVAANSALSTGASTATSATPAMTVPSATIMNPAACAETTTQRSPQKSKGDVPVRSSIEIVKATSPSHTEDVQLSLVSSTSEVASNTSRPVTPVGGNSNTSRPVTPVGGHDATSRPVTPVGALSAGAQKGKNGPPAKRKRKGPKTIRDLLEARQASSVPRDNTDSNSKSTSVLVTPKMPQLGMVAPPAMVNVMVQGNSVQSVSLPCSTPHVQPVQMVSEGVQTCDEDREEGADLPVLTSRKRKMEDQGQGQPMEKKVKDKVRKTKDKMKKIKDIEPSITYVTECGLPTKEPDSEKMKRASPENQAQTSTSGGGESPSVDAPPRAETPVPEGAQQAGKKKTSVGRKRGRQSYTIGKGVRTSPATVEDILEAAKNEPPALKVKFPPTDGTACMFDTPLFMPTEQEFQDPMAYIAKIRPEAEKYGMCRIQPPPSWKPDCKVHDEMRFTSQIQYIHLTHHRWGPNREKMACIKKHLKSQAVDVEQLPLIGGIELDLPRLGATIQEFGGLQHVLDKKKWNKVADVMGISKLALDRTTKLYDAYCKYLLSYDTLCKEDKERIRTQVLAEKNSEELEKEKACVIKGRSNSLCGFYRAARNTMAMWFKEDPTSEQSENEYWRVVESGRHHVAVQCGQVDTRVTGSGFPNRKENPYSRHPWNLNILANNSGSVLRHLGPIPGVTIPTLYVRMLFTSSCWSRDLHLMPYIAYMHSGSDLIWYSVAKSQHSKFREVVTEMFPERVDDTSVWLKKDMIMVPPKQLVARGVSVTRTVQKQRQFVVVFPEVYTANISCGYSISEQVNLAHPDYLPLGHHAAKMLNESAVPEQFPYEKMLISLAKNEKVPMEVLCLLVPLLEKVVEEELHYRHQLQTAGLKRSDRMCVIDEPVQASWKKRRTMDTSEEEENICEISKKICFISMVVNEAEDIIYSLPHAMPHVQKKKSLKSCKLLYRYSEDELKQLLHSAKERLTNPPEVAPKKRKCKPAAAAGSEADTATEATTSQ
ncbi:mucin-2-like isoform X1 [Lineus longissimus]|uniref:mucin-2-like isoform X1 n=1 Tax=Lineus longissimus TaxID=88925 RepID=UPI002B4F6DC9